MALGSAIDLSNAVVVTAGEVAQALGWSTKRAKLWLQREGIARKQKTGRYGRYYTTRGLLRSAFPEAADDIIARLSNE